MNTHLKRRCDMYKIEYKIKNLVSPSELGESRLLGGIGEKFDRVIFERLSGEYARTEIFGEAESAFETCVDDEKAPIGIWQGEFWGKQMISACRAYRYNGDESLEKFITDSCYRIMSHQREDGYLGTYKNEKQIFHTSKYNGRKIMGWDCEWTWNIWCRKYTLWGLLEAYEVTGDERILDSAVRSANQLIDMLHEMGARICETGMFYGQPSGSILKPILLLYRITGDKKYLDFALEIANQWEDEDTCCTKLITMALYMQPIHEWSFPVVGMSPKSRYNPLVGEGKPVFDITTTKPETSGKVYEMQSCFDGILELYRITGEEKYLTATKNFFELMLRDEYNVLCSVGFNDLFIRGGRFQNSISELCDVIHFIRLATELHRLTGEARYIDLAELAFVNCFLAGVTRDGKWGARGVRAAEKHLFVHLQAGFTKNHCCVNNMPRGFANMAEAAVMTSGGDIYLNLFTEARVTVHPFEKEDVTVEIGDGYLASQKVEVTVSARLSSEDGRLLRIRIPNWSRYTILRAYKETYVINETGYYNIPLKNGKHVLSLHFDSTPRLIEGNYNFGFYPTTPYMIQRYTSAEDISLDTLITENHATLFVGPVLLAMSKELGSTKEEIFERPTVAGGEYKVKAVPRIVDGFSCAYDVSFTTDMEGYSDFIIPMGDFASASDSEDKGKYSYGIFL